MKDKYKLMSFVLLNFIVGGLICIIIQHIFKWVGINPHGFVCGYLVCFIQALYVIEITFSKSYKTK